MCIIIHCETDKRPTRDILERCNEDNPHGIGVSWREGDFVHWKKTDSLDFAEKLINDLEGEIVIHFRWASAGGISKALRHPFPIRRSASTSATGKSKSVLFQNGTARGWKEVKAHLENRDDFPAGDMSDTRLGAYLLSLESIKDRKLALKLFSDTSRFLVMSTTKTIRLGAWKKIGAFWYSKDLPVRKRQSPPTRLPNHADAMEEEWKLVDEHRQSYARRRYQSYWKHFEKSKA